MASTCEIDEALLAQIDALRLDKASEGNAAIICKILTDKLLVVQEHPEKGFLRIEDLGDMVPDSAPRYIILSIKLDHNDGRVSYPMVFLYYAPKSVRPELNMLYAGTKAHFNRTTKAVKALDVEDDEVLNVEWLRNSLLK